MRRKRIISEEWAGLQKGVGVVNIGMAGQQTRHVQGHEIWFFLKMCYILTGNFDIPNVDSTLVTPQQLWVEI